MSDMSTWQDILTHMMLHPPPANDPVPFTNKKATLFGVALSCLAISWPAVLFRLYVRIRIVKDFGWDDAFVFLAQAINTGATILMCCSVKHGLGRHMVYLPFDELFTYLKVYYVEIGLYITVCGVIKAALLLQYLRIFRAGTMRWVCVGLLIIVGLWTIAFALTAWFPCFPVYGYWQRTIPAKCYGFGFGTLQGFVAMYKAHSATNMMFDIAIFITPMILFRSPNLRKKNLIAMTGVFLIGAVVVATAVGRMYRIVQTNAATHPYLDYTWWSPLIIILSCLEIHLAVICASMPIFWPIIEKSFGAILVSYEVHVVEERVDEYGLSYELEHKTTADQASLKSNATSTRELTLQDEEQNPQRPQFTLGCDPLDEEQRNAGFTANVETLASQPKWQL